MSFPLSHFFDVPFLYFKLTLSSFLAWVVWDKCLINSNDNNFCYLYLSYMQWNVGGDWNSQGVQKLSQEMAFLWFCVDAHWMYIASTICFSLVLSPPNWIILSSPTSYECFLSMLELLPSMKQAWYTSQILKKNVKIWRLPITNNLHFQWWGFSIHQPHPFFRKSMYSWLKYLSTLLNWVFLFQDFTWLLRSYVVLVPHSFKQNKTPLVMQTKTCKWTKLVFYEKKNPIKYMEEGEWEPFKIDYRRLCL